MEPQRFAVGKLWGRQNCSNMEESPELVFGLFSVFSLLFLHFSVTFKLNLIWNVVPRLTIAIQEPFAVWNFLTVVVT